MAKIDLPFNFKPRPSGDAPVLPGEGGVAELRIPVIPIQTQHHIIGVPEIHSKYLFKFHGFHRIFFLDKIAPLTF